MKVIDPTTIETTIFWYTADELYLLDITRFHHTRNCYTELMHQQHHTMLYLIEIGFLSNISYHHMDYCISGIFDFAIYDYVLDSSKMRLPFVSEEKLVEFLLRFAN